ncbi:hypothetical protein LEP1GSC081_1359 [Leptospira kirschneri str. H1]|uniref:Uncharacterized protein n=1 Tax=Leptospira kirschneri str. H1 TaxID=1049966 RepID=A0A0E2B5D6_9LEPT|nr:hypothetical protein LEP1GSC081_1359 [Leptospira kirschneri str. H1]
MYTTKNKLERENTFVRWFEKETVNFNSSLSEVATIVVYFHLSHYREFKNYYLIEIKRI